MNFGDIYSTLVYNPLLNILQLIYTITGDTGIAIVGIGILINLILWPFFSSAYINAQKTKVLQPLTAQIREKYKDNPQALFKELGEFNKKHNIKNGSIFIIFAFQLIFATAIWTITRTISSSDTIDGVVKLPGLYESLFGTSTTNFEKIAFNWLNIGDSGTTHLWLPVLTAFLSFAYGYYTFRIAPKPKIIEVKIKKKPKKDTQKPVFDPEAFQKSIEIQTIYLIPLLMLFINLGLTVGVNIYFATVSVISLLRQIILTNYYNGHTDKLVDDIVKSDPTFQDDDRSNNFEVTATGDITSQDEVPMLVIKKERKTKKKLKSTKSTNRSNKKK